MTLTTPLIGLRARSRIASFQLHRPKTVAEAFACMNAAGPDARYMAGGIDLVNRMKDGFSATDVVYLGDVDALRAIDVEHDCLRIGATVTHKQLAESLSIRTLCPSLSEAWAGIAQPRVRFKGTVGGNLMANEPAYEARPMLAALGATARFYTGETSYKDVPLSMLDAPLGLLHSIAVPLGQSLRFDRSMGPVVNVALALRYKGKLIAEATFAIGASYDRPQLVRIPLERALSAAELQRRVEDGRLLDALPPPRGDWRAGSSYRRRMAAVLLKRLLQTEASR